QEWQAAASAISTTTAPIPASAWRTPLSRHLQLAAFLEGSHDGNGRTSGNSTIDGNDLLLAEQENKEGNTHPLHVAASQNILKLGTILLSGAGLPVNPSVRDTWGQTPLHWAAMTDRVPFMLLLLEAGASIDALDCRDRTPLLSASAFGSAAAVRVLLQSGADPSEPSRGGLTPLHAAAAGGHLEVAELLIGGGADVDKLTGMGASPRHLAARQGHSDVEGVLSAASPRSRRSSSSSSSSSSSFAGGSDLWRGGGGGGGGYAGAEEEQRFFAQHRFERASLLQRPLFR
ncbi:unnamed protein product, partial [Hapterophycus canaliculatus]